MNNKLISPLIAILIAVTALVTPGCKDKGLKDAAEASDTMAGSISALILAKRELAKSGKLTRDEEIKLTQALFALNEAVIVFNDQAKNATTWDTSVKDGLARLFSDVTSALTSLNNSGALAVNNPEAKQKLTGIIAGIEASVAIISGVLG